MGNNIKNRILYLDILRIITCFGVIANHTNIILMKADVSVTSVGNIDLIGGVLWMVMCKNSVTLFLMISGVLLLKKVDSYKKNVQRIFRIGMVLLVFSFGYYMVLNMHTPFDFVKTITRTNVTRAFWYLYLYLGILVMLPVLQKMVKNFKKADFLYFLFFSLVICSFSIITEYNVNFSLPVFATSVGIFILGYYLDNYIDLRKYDFKLFIAAGLVGSGIIITFLFAYTYYGILFNSNTAYNLLVYDNIFYVMFSIFVFLMVKYAMVRKEHSGRFKNIICFVGSCTFGIYLFSDYFISLIMPIFERWADVSEFWMLLIVFLLDLMVFALGLVITALLKWIPIIKCFL